MATAESVIDAAIRDLVRAAVSEVVAPLALEIRQLRATLARQPTRWVTRAEAAGARACSIDTIDRLISSGELQSQKLGRSVRVLLEEPATDIDVARLVARGAAAAR